MLLRPRTKPSRSNSMMRIKRCGHAFCYDCLETWVQKQNTCPMCRDQLFSDSRREKYRSESDQGDRVLLLTLRGYLDMREAREVSDSVVRSALDSDGHGYGGDEWADVHGGAMVRGSEMI